MRTEIFSGRVVDPIKKRIFGARISIKDKRIVAIDEEQNPDEIFILPGLVDSHLHIESSMLIPERFAEAALRHGTVAVVADPHEVANVAGVKGVRFMIDNAQHSLLKIFFGAPSCVPASPFDECYQAFTAKEISEILSFSNVACLAEMMNFPGVVNASPEVIKILDEAKLNNKPIDGHAPGLSGEALMKYIAQGISTDHECFTLDEAKEKISHGMKVLIRDGSAAKNFDALHSLIKSYPDMVMFCTDDCHPDELLLGHINKHVKKALSFGYDIFDILTVASVNPVRHYNLPVGLLQIGDFADFILVDDLKNFNIIQTYINGEPILNHNNFSSINEKHPDFVFPSSFDKSKIEINLTVGKKIKVIGALNGELITNVLETPAMSSGYDIPNDIIKIVVVSRYNPNNIGVGFINGFGLKKGALAASIAHDSHHIVAVGTNDHSIFMAIDYIIKNKGGISFSDGKNVTGMPLPYYGLMTNTTIEEAAKAYSSINELVKKNGSNLYAPYMTMSFMLLSVIPHLKLTPQGYFDVDKFNFTSIYV